MSSSHKRTFGRAEKSQTSPWPWPSFGNAGTRYPPALAHPAPYIPGTEFAWRGRWLAVNHGIEGRFSALTAAERDRLSPNSRVQAEPAVRASGLTLAGAALRELEQALDVLGIEVPERM